MGFGGTTGVVRAHVGRVSNDEAKKLLREFKGLVHMWVKRYWPTKRKSACLDVEDMESVAKTALLEAHATWDPSRNVSKMTWYSTVIQHRLSVYTAQVLDLDRHEMQARTRVKAHERAVEAYAKAHGVSPEEVDPSLAGIAPLDPRHAAWWEEAQGRTYASTHAPLSHEEDGGVVGDLLVDETADTEAALAKQERREWFYALVDEVLSEREKDALFSWLDGTSLRQVATCNDITRQRFSLVRGEALAKVYYAATGIVLEPAHSVDAYLAQIEALSAGDLLKLADHVKHQRRPSARGLAKRESYAKQKRARQEAAQAAEDLAKRLEAPPPTLSVEVDVSLGGEPAQHARVDVWLE